MNTRWNGIGSGVMFAAMLLAADAPQVAHACGGFFCQQVPIDQAGEQIIFREENGQVTVVVLIQYEGNAEDFSWVLPVPGVPEFELASDLVFGPLEQATRPQFFLEIEGEECETNEAASESPSADSGGAGASEDGDADDGVDVLEEVAVGPFDILVVSSEDPAAMTQWLSDNDYDLADRGEELIGPYVEAGMNFVAMRLRQDQGVGDIQPLKMVYGSDEAMIPIRLTAVAALENMGVLVWMLGESRAVPLNYPHVEVNYTKLNWYNGSFAAYADYQDLVTEAMNEFGNGQGFVTDYAGTDLDVVSQLPDPQFYRDQIVFLGGLQDNIEFYGQLTASFVFPLDKVLEIMMRNIPLPEGEDPIIYQIPDLLIDAVGEETLTAARTPILDELIDAIIVPLEATIEVFDGMPYLTRLYTTLSADEMTMDPTFSYNPDLEDQPLTRNATMRLSCVDNLTHWVVELGPGTDRDGEIVINGTGSPPGFSVGAPEVDQSAVSRAVQLSTRGIGEPVTENTFALLEINNPGGEGSGGAGQGSGMGNATGFFGLGGDGGGLCGIGAIVPLVAVIGLAVVRLDRRR